MRGALLFALLCVLTPQLCSAQFGIIGDAVGKVKDVASSGVNFVREDVAPKLIGGAKFIAGSAKSSFTLMNPLASPKAKFEALNDQMTRGGKIASAVNGATDWAVGKVIDGAKWAGNTAPGKFLGKVAKESVKYNPMTAGVYWANKGLGDPLGKAAKKGAELAKEHIPKGIGFLKKANNALANGYGSLGQAAFGVDKKESAKAFKAGENALVTAASFIPVAKGAGVAISAAKQAGIRTLFGAGGKQAAKTWLSSPGSFKDFAKEGVKAGAKKVAEKEAVGAGGRLARVWGAVKSSRASEFVSNKWNALKGSAAGQKVTQWAQKGQQFWKKNGPKIETGKALFDKGKGWFHTWHGVVLGQQAQQAQERRQQRQQGSSPQQQRRRSSPQQQQQRRSSPQQQQRRSSPQQQQQRRPQQSQPRGRRS